MKTKLLDRSYSEQIFTNFDKMKETRTQGVIARAMDKGEGQDSFNAFKCEHR